MIRGVLNRVRRSVLTAILLILIAAGIGSTLLFLCILTPTLQGYFQERNRTSLTLATLLAVEICESGFENLLQLRLSDESSMVETIRRDSLQRITDIDTQFAHLQLFIINDERKIILNSGISPELAEEFSTLPRKGPNMAEPSSADPGALIHWRYFPFFRWRIVAYMSSTDILMPIRQTQRAAMAAMGTTVVIMLVTLLVTFLHYVKSPLQLLINSAEKVAAGRLEPVKVARKDELGMVAQAFNDMIRSLKEKEDLIQSAMEDMTRSVEEKEVLLREVHHRVRNNLNVIVSLLNLRAATLTDTEDAVRAFQESKNRIRIMAAIHQKLYETDDYSRIRMDEHIRDLASDLREAYDIGPAITIDFQLEKTSIDMNRAIPLGLILNEALANSFQHAFAGHEKSRVGIVLEHENGNCRLTVYDNGKGFATAAPGGSSLGHTLIRELAQQLDGTAYIDGSRGTRVIIEFPHNDA